MRIVILWVVLLRIKPFISFCKLYVPPLQVLCLTSVCVSVKGCCLDFTCCFAVAVTGEAAGGSFSGLIFYSDRFEMRVTGAAWEGQSTAVVF